MRHFLDLARIPTLLVLILGLTTSIFTSLPTNKTHSPIPTHHLPTHHLPKRGVIPLRINDFTLKASQQLTLLLPAQAAAAQLEYFYAAISRKARTQWIHTLPKPLVYFSIKWSGLELLFVANEQTNPEGIPWEFVRDFAELMVEVTRKGFTGCYDQGFWNVAGTVGVYVGLRYVGAQQQ